MTYHARHYEAEEQDFERRIIRVDSKPDQAGIAAALRRAFAAGRVEDADEEFGELLKQLN